VELSLVLNMLYWNVYIMRGVDTRFLEDEQMISAGSDRPRPCSWDPSQESEIEERVAFLETMLP
jgi:hypothetical protein